MSSTNRGAAREIADYYTTPVGHISRFLTAWAADHNNPKGFTSVRHILDPCAGGRVGFEHMSYVDALHEATPRLFPSLHKIDTVDIREDSRAEFKGDYLEFSPELKYDLIITNPPFNIAQKVIEKALREVVVNGFVVMLLRLNYLGSDERLLFWQRNPPQRIYVHSKRMGFLRHRTDLPPKQRNATDSIEYAHFVWQNGQGYGSHIRVI